MSATPAAHLARLKVEHQAWQITRTANGMLIARHAANTMILYARTPDDMEAALAEAGAGWRSRSGGRP